MSNIAKPWMMILFAALILLFVTIFMANSWWGAAFALGGCGLVAWILLGVMIEDL